MGTAAAYCTSSGNTLVPTELARSPWGQTIAGHVVGGVLARAVERAGGDPEFQPSRLTVDLIRPTVFEPFEVAVNVQRGGKRIRLVEASLIQGGAVAARVSALYLRRGEHPSERVWSSPVTMPPVPGEPDPLPVPILVHSYGWAAKGAGTVLPTEWPQATPGQKYAWIRHVIPLVEGEPVTPFVCAAMAGDATSAVAHWGQEDMNFINVDYTLSLSRLPDGPYIGLAALTHSGHDGVATGTAAVFDRHGQIGTCVTNALANPGWRAPY